MKRILCAFATVAVLVCCVKEQHENKPGRSFMIAESEDFDFDKILTKAPGSSSVPSFAWESEDEIGVFPLGGNSILAAYELVKYGASPKVAAFECNMLELREGGSYAAFYPYSETTVHNDGVMELYFAGQKQSANNSTSHIRDYNYMYASTVATSTTNASLQFKRLVGLVGIQLKVPETDIFKKISIESSSDWFASKAELSLKKEKIVSKTLKKSCSVALDDIPLKSGEVLTVWFSMLPTSVLDEKSVTVKLIGDETLSSAEISDLPEIEAGKAYFFACAPVINGKVEYGEVDLGLSVKWSACNLGASSPEEFGDYYAWNEVETKPSYSLNSYNTYRLENIVEKQIEKENKGYIKYIPKSKADSYGFLSFYDDKEVLDPDDDIAHFTLKGKWRMPSKEEFDELIVNCKSEWVSYKGVNGRKFTSKVEGYEDKWIFLPAAGYNNGSHLYNAGTYGSYWASTLYTVYPNYAYYLYFNSDYVYTLNYSRFYGQTIRPVLDD